MSKGNKIVPLRIPPDMLAEVEERIARRNDATAAEIWTLSGYIRHCIASDLAHARRSRKRVKSPAKPVDESSAPQTGQTGQEEGSN